ncbi:hypothetical protein [Pontiella agarivorans]|uniref:Uncharacterized protein n=1 Tax=Pontiella agarivorans TaxID=3038953 RepID=A0ABU5N1U2_9BACT|nr:hypothetical protein [Pontiella agarivorans]MDZ8120405.1 hypothetical protein [Pontiella agarivorans]
MLRFLRITGVVVFSVLVGVTAYNIKKMQESGALYEKYNYERRSNITLLSSSMLALLTLGYFEINSMRRRREQYHLGDGRYRKGRDDEAAGRDTSSIYTAPRQIDEWKGRSHKHAKMHKKLPGKKEGVGAGLLFLRVFSVVLPVVYAVLLAWTLMRWTEYERPAILLPAFFVVLLMVSMLAAIGIHWKKTWGLSLGYLLALGNLMIFPYGTAMGLLLILALVASGDAFAESAARKRRKSHRRDVPRSTTRAF